MRGVVVGSHYNTILVEGGRTIKGDVLIIESVLNEQVRYISVQRKRLVFRNITTRFFTGILQFPFLQFSMFQTL